MAALSVLCSHVLLYGVADDPLGRPMRLISALELGVVLFFTLSGFLLYRAFASAILGFRAGVDVRDYAIGRALRILPAYWVALAIVGLVVPAALVHVGGGHLGLGDLRGAPGVLGANVVLIQNYIPATAITGIGPAWTLAVEVAFYVALPLLALPALALARRRHLSLRSRLALALAPPATLLVIGVGIGEAARVFPSIASPDWSDTWQTVLMRSFLASGGLFAAGMTAAVVLLLAEHGVISLPRGARRAALGLAIGGIVLVVVAHDRGLVPDEFFWLAASAPCAFLLFHLAATEDVRRSPAARLLETRFLVYAGLVSYSVYLWHEPLIRWLAAHDLTFHGRWADAGNVALVTSLTLAIATVSCLLVERPAMSLRTRRRAPGAASDRVPARSEPLAEHG
jgi:peptidoglycan/LPS O-acetylase OafA/YrhL